jgi:hypothetical protein
MKRAGISALGARVSNRRRDDAADLGVLAKFLETCVKITC